MIRKTLLISLVSIGFFSQAGAVMQPQNTYDTFEAFQASGDAPICKVVTDGCNEWYFADGQKADPIKLCKLTQDFQYFWSCEQYNDDIMFLQGGLENTTTNDIIYIDPLTPQERADYTKMMEKLSEAEFAKILNVTEKYINLRSKYSQEQQKRYEAKIQTAIQKHIDIRISQGDISKDRIFLMLQYLKLELKVLSQNYPIGGLTPLSGELYSCTGKEYRVYDTDYFIDDMGFVVEKDTIHVSDGTFLLPNYVAKREISASGEKYTGTNTETQEAYTFWMKENELSVYKADTLIDTCTKK